jgi:hypothetical protein
VGNQFLSLDTILSATFFHAKKWNPDLVGSQARDLLRFLTIKLYAGSNGNLNTASLTISQSALAGKIEVTREWCNKLLASLKDAGWIHYTSTRRADGLRTRCTYTLGNVMRRLLVMLAKSHAKKAKQKRVVNSGSQFFPFSMKKKFSFILEREQESPRPELLAKIPLLKRWMGRGKESRQ